MQAALSRSPNAASTHFYSSSGGNAGLACVHAARVLGRPATVVVPLSTKPMMLAKIRAAGAHAVLQHGATWRDADTYMRETVLVGAEERGEVGVYVPPFDAEDIWHGHATLVGEVQRQLQEQTGHEQPDVVVCSVGGGGLLNGVMEGVRRAGWEATTVLALETRGAHSLSASLEQGSHVTIPGITSQATSLGAVRVSERTFELASTDRRIKSAVLGDDEAAMGCWRLADDERFLVELACGVNVALCYGARLEKALGRQVRPDEKVVIVLCGGSAVTVDMIAGWKKEFGHLHDEQIDGETKTVASAVTV